MAHTSHGVMAAAILISDHSGLGGEGYCRVRLFMFHGVTWVVVMAYLI